MMRNLAVVALVVGSLAAHGAGVQADHVVTDIEGDDERVEVGQWIQDDLGRSRFDIDDWTRIVDPVEGVEWRANSKRGIYSKARTRFPTVPMGTPLIDLPGSFDGPGSREISRTDLGIRVIDGVECKGTLVEVEISGRGFRQRMEFEAWLTEAFAFPFNVEFAVRMDAGAQTTQLRNIVELTDSQMEGVFKPDDDWKESRFAVTRTNVAWTGIWPFTKAGTKETGSIWPWPKPRQKQDW